MTELETEVLELWNELKRIIDANDADMIKSVNKNRLAGTRGRHGLRIISRRAAALCKRSLAMDKELQVENATKNQVKKELLGNE